MFVKSDYYTTFLLHSRFKNNSDPFLFAVYCDVHVKWERKEKNQSTLNNFTI